MPRADKPRSSEVNFGGEYRVTCRVTEDMVAVGLADKPCWEIDGPDGLKAIV
jgi:hypothetical protein